MDLLPSGRGGLVWEPALSARFRRHRYDLGLAEGLDMHSLRRSSVTYLLEAGIDAMFVQHQVGHEHASTTASSIRDLVRQVPPPILATQLRYSNHTAFRHAALAAEPLSNCGRIATAHLQQT